MKIVIDARELRTSTGRYVERLLHYLQQIDHDHDYVILLTPKDIDTWQVTNSRFQKVACPHKEFTLAEQLGLARQIYKLQADLVHFTITQQPVLYGGKAITTVHDLTTARFRNPAKNPIVFTVKQWVYRWLIKRVAHKSIALLTPSGFVKQDLVQFSGIDPTKVTVTYEAADAIELAAEPIGNLGGKQFIMYLGRPTPHKNLGRLIETHQKLLGQHPDLLLVLAGKKDVNYRRIEAGVRQRQLSNIIFTDFVSEGQLRWLYENCAAYIFPSLSEGFGLPGLEAMIHGAPVVSSNATCLPEVYGQAAHYFDPIDVNSMARAIHEVLSDEKLRQSLVEAGRQQAGNYSWQRMAEQTLEIYKKALGEIR
ncbi:MAG TPA: glycosyltransferase family 1 protein [Candidatus Saccharimonadales bacterium]|nr:glycosyltransferase family 1 protein [Candidatus Saccharimonadales bacterium]